MALSQVKRLIACSAALFGVSACITPAPHTLADGAHYVAMGSSFASGPGILPKQTGTPPRCGRSALNYAQHLAQIRGLDLTDVTCSGARTTHVLGAWRELPAQLDAIRPDTALVTVTIGGNDIGYIGGLINASCAALAKVNTEATSKCRPVVSPSAADYQGLENRLRQIAVETRARAPKAALVFVSYMAVLPPQGVCSAVPLAAQQADASRMIGARLDAITARVAKEQGGIFVDSASVTGAHHACAQVPWMQGYDANPDWKTQVPYHPTGEGMAAVARLIDRTLDETQAGQR